MKLISCRENFYDADVLSRQGHWICAEHHSPELLSPEHLETMRGKRLLILVHGFNNDIEEVQDAYTVVDRNIQLFISNHYHAVLGYIWPGGNDVFDWWSAKSRANSVARRFRELLQLCSKYRIRIDIMSHSLGARVVLKALKLLTNNKLAPIVDNYYCLAAAVDNESLEAEQEFAHVSEQINQMLIFYSKNDTVLATMYRLSALDNALGLSGAEDHSYVRRHLKNVWQINCKKSVKSHGAYKYNTEIFRYISKHSEKPSRIRATTLS